MTQDKDCRLKKEKIQKQFDLKNYQKTVKLFEDFKKCHKDEVIYYSKLGLLYDMIDEKEKSKKTFIKILELLENDDKISQNQKSLSKASLLMFLNDRTKMKNELKKIDQTNLTEQQKMELESLQMIANQGEFIATEYKIDFKDFKLFD